MSCPCGTGTFPYHANANASSPITQPTLPGRSIYKPPLRATANPIQNIFGRGLGAGFKKDMISVVTYRGREHSRFTPLDKLGPHALKAFTGQYDLFGSPVYSEGELFIDSIHRFKGRSAPCIVFTEIDFEALDEAALRKLFVGMTRATMKLVMFMSERAAGAMLGRLGDYLSLTRNENNSLRNSSPSTAMG